MKLNQEQQEFIKNNFLEIPDLIELTRQVFKDDTLDGRTKEGRTVRAFLVESNLEYNTTKKEKREDIEFTEEQQEFILQYAKEEMSAYEICKILFPEVNVTNLSKEVIEVAKFIEEIDEGLLHPTESALNSQYFAPKSNSRVIKKINDYCQEELNEKELGQQEIDNIESTKKFLSAPRFIQVINTYSSMDDRNLFEAEFIRSVWDKPDLTSDELNLYINVCMDYIHLKNISKAIDKLNRMFEDCDDQRDMTVRLAELLKTKSEEYNQCEKRQETLIARLNGDRKERVKNRHKDNSSILSLVKVFQNETDRKRMVEMAEKQKLIIAEEADRIENMDVWKARVLGISKDETL
ncbi:hypothetical protein OAA62_01070 [bacterium]|nr:hypothetical protein [bacterium]